MANQRYLSFDFKNFNEKGLSKVKKEFESNGLVVTSIDADNRVRRQSGVPTKRATFNIADGQQVVLQATSEGAVFQVRLNSRVIPVRAVDNLKAAIAEISNRVKANSSQFQKARRRRATAPKKVDKATVARTSAKARIVLYQQQAEELQQTVNELEERKQTLSAQVSENEGSISTLTGQIEEAKAENERLQSELVSLGEAA
ncbi:hypothetical protein [Endozoicomonas lisbonensis]